MTPCRRFALTALAALLVTALPMLATAQADVTLLDPSHFESERITFSSTPELSQKGHVIRATLANHVELRFDTQKLFMQVVSPQGRVLAESEPGEILQVKYIPQGIGPDVKVYDADLKFTFQKVIVGEESVNLWFEATAFDGTTSKVKWSFYPIDYVIHGMSMSGVADQFHIESSSHYLHRVKLRWRGPVGDDFEGARTFRFSCFPGNKKAYSEAVFTRSERKTLGDWGMFIDAGQMFHLIELPNQRGTIVEFMDEPVHCRSSIGATGENDAVAVSYDVRVGRMVMYTSPLRIRMLTQENLSSNLWIQMTQFIKSKYQSDLHVPPSAPRPMAVIRNKWRESSFEEHARELLPILDDHGYRQVEIGWVWKRGNMLESQDPWPTLKVWDGSQLEGTTHFQTDRNDEITDTAGGIQGLARFAELAHQRGMKVFIWHQTAHGWAGMPDVRQHPEWLSYKANGTVRGWTNKDRMPVIWFDLNSRWKQVTLERLRKIKQATNIDGLWLDIYATGSTANFSKPVTSYSTAERSDYIRQLREMGYDIQAEGVTIETVDSFVMRKDDLPFYQQHPFILFGSCPFRMAATSKYGHVDLFKAMSYRSFPHDRGEQWKQTTDAEEERIRALYAAEVKYRNHCFNQIEDRLGQVIGVVEIDGGTQWVCERGNAVFVWDDAQLSITAQQQMALLDVLTPDQQTAPLPLDSPRRQWQMETSPQTVLLFGHTTP